MTSFGAIALGLAALFLACPITYSLWRALRGDSGDAPGAWDWRLTFKSTLAFALAFNVMFFIQEFFLVIPKAMVPGLQPTLFHNNHVWRGSQPIQELLQGTGALATVIAGASFAVWLIRRPRVGDAARLVVFWLAILGFLTALPQVVIGTVIPQNDVGRAMGYLDLSEVARLLASIGAFSAMALVCWRLTPYLLSMSAGEGTPRGRAAIAFRMAVLPCVFAIPLIAAYRVPNAAIEVWLPPCVDAAIAAAWIQAAAWSVDSAAAVKPRRQSPLWLLMAAGCLLAFFHGVLRRGIDFF